MHKLTEKEKAVLPLLGEGLSRVQIADRLGKSVPCVASRIGRIFRKLGAVNRAHAVYIAYQAGLLNDPDPPRFEASGVVRVPLDPPEVIAARRRVLLGEEDA